MSDSEEDIFKGPDSDSDSDNESVANSEDENNVKKIIKVNKFQGDDEIEDEEEEDEEEGDVPEIISDDDDDIKEIQESDDDDDEDHNDDSEDESQEIIIKKKKPKLIISSNDTIIETGDNEIINNNHLEQDDSDSDDEADENYLQKFNQQLKHNYTEEFHPECYIHNYQEISALSKVIRDKNNIIIDPLHRTIPFLTKYEKARVLGQRAKQINSGAKPFVKVPENVIDGALIAELELVQKRIPFIIRRPFPGGGGSEYWNLRDLECF